MAKTNDDIFDILSELVTILKEQNKNGGSNSLGANIGTQDDIFKSLFNGFNELKRSAEVMTKKHHEYANSLNSKELKENIKKLIDGYTDANGEVVQGLKDLNSSFGRGAEKFNTTQKYYKEIAKTMDEQNSIVQDINVKRANLFGLEQKLYNDKLKIEEAELEAKQKYAKEIEESSKRAAEAAEAFSETKIVLDTLQQDIESIKKEVRNARKSEVEETGELQKANAEKQEHINITHENAMAKKEEKRLEGYNKKGQKKANAELKEILGNAKAYFKENSKGRIVADGVNMAAQGAAKAAKTIQSGKMDVSGMADKATAALSKMGPYGAAAGGLVQILKVAFEMFSKVDKAASDYARSVGGGRESMLKMREEAASLASQMSKMGRTAYMAEDILARMGEASESLGRNLEGLSTADLRSLQDLKNFGIDNTVIAQMDTFGVSVHNVSKQLADLYGESGKRGLNAKATIKAFTSNLKMAQNYTFARGQKALMDMAMKSAQLKFNLRDAEQFANKVSTLEGAMTAGAQLSVLGGNFARQGNPLAMLYGGLNDIESLQESMLAITKDMARWDRSKDQLEITAFDRQRLKAMSEATGIDYSDLTSQALNQARVDRVSSQLGGGFKKEEEEYIKNLASLDEHGNAYIQVDGQQYSMDEIRRNKDGVRNQLKKESEAKDTKEGADLGDIWSSTRGIQDRLDDIIKTIQTQIVALLMKIAKPSEAEMAAMKAGIDLNDEDAIKQIKKQKRKQNWERIGIYTSAGAAASASLGGVPGAVAGFLGGTIHNIAKNDTDELAKWAIDNKIGEQKKASGGFISGKGGPTDDAIPARLSNGEFVVNAESTKIHRPLLEKINNGDIKNGENLMKHISINTSTDNKNISNNSQNNQKVDISPIKIEFGTLTLQLGDLTRIIDSNEMASKLLNNSVFVDNIIKEIGIRSNFGYRKEDSSNKFLNSPYSRSF